MPKIKLLTVFNISLMRYLKIVLIVLIVSFLLIGISCENSNKEISIQNAYCGGIVYDKFYMKDSQGRKHYFLIIDYNSERTEVLVPEVDFYDYKVLDTVMCSHHRDVLDLIIEEHLRSKSNLKQAAAAE